MVKSPLSGLDDGLLQQLSGGLDAQQQIWLSGYLYGLAQQTQANGQIPQTTALQTPTSVPQPLQQGIPVSAPPVLEKPKLTVLYGSQSGNSKHVAKLAVQNAEKRGFTVALQDMNDYTTQQLKNEQYMLVVVSTYGEGEPPAAAETLHQFLHSARAPKLPNLKYSVLALGDRSYAQFCQTGIEFDQKLAELGATRIADRMDCDTDFHDDAEKWIETALESIAARSGANIPTEALHTAQPATAYAANGHGAYIAELPAAAPQIVYDRKNPFPATVLEKVQLNGRGSPKETWHVELSLEDSGLSYEPGDALGIWPENPPELVQAVLKATRLVAAEKVNWQGEWLSLGEVLTRHAELSLLSKDTLEKIYVKVRSPRLAAIISNADALRKYIYGRDLADVLIEYNDLWSGESLVKILRRIQPRLYSIASSLEAHPDEVHLTIGAVRYDQNGRKRRGVASSWLADSLETGKTVKVFIEKNEYFKLPKDPDQKVIMVGPGTGIAPFRAFVEERAAQGAKGENWLFFGNPHFTTDFLYQLEWQQALKKGHLSRIDLAFSRDQGQKVYVQDKLLKNSGEIFRQLEAGAYFYVCGDKNRMASDVEKTLIKIVAQENAVSEDKAAEYVKNLKKSRRYLEDVY